LQKFYKYSVYLLSIIIVFSFTVEKGLAANPVSPSSIRVVSGDEKIFLTWDYNGITDELSGYKIYVSEDFGNNFDQTVDIAGSLSANFYILSNLDNGKEYIIGLSVYNDIGEESDIIHSEIVIPADTSYTDILPPENISNLVANGADMKVILTWGSSLDTQNDLVGYKLYISEDNGLSFSSGKNIGYVNNYTVKNLNNGEEYIFKITGYDEVYNENIGIATEIVIPNNSSSSGGDSDSGVQFGDNVQTTNTFIDVDNSNIFKSYIEYLSARGVINGYLNRTFLPNNFLTRAEAVKIILKSTGIDEVEEITETSFSDVSPENPLASYIEKAFLYNIVRGYGDYTFKPDLSVSRKEFAKMFMEANLGTLENPVTKAYFVDVGVDHSFSKWIYSAYKKGYINGYEDQTFKPENKITRAEASKIIASYLQGETQQLPQNSNLELYLLSLINASRIDRSLSTLTADRELSIIARNHAEDLANNVKSPESTGSDGRTLFDRLDDAGVSYKETSENVAKININGRTDYQAIETLHSMIILQEDNKQNQKANILSTYKNFNTIGIGIEENDGYLYVVATFIS